RGKGMAQAVNGSPGAARASAHAQSGGSQEAAAVESVLGRRVPRRSERVFSSALRLVVGAAANRSAGSEPPTERRSHRHGDRTADLQGACADGEGPSRSGEQGRL